MSAKITFIGAGNMATSLAGGLIAKGYPNTDITMTDLNEDQLLHNRNTLGVKTTQDNTQACNNADVIVLAVKPQVMAKVAVPLKDIVAQRSPLVVSIAAGITLSNLQQWLGNSAPIVRCMPNTPALVQSAASGLFANQHVSDHQKALAKDVMSAVGLALWVENEDQIDAVTALSGSGPAYFLLVMQAMMETGRSLGLPESIASQLTLQTALGSAQLALASDVDVAELRRRVTSPGGTTERAIGIMQEKGLEGIFADALKGAYDRSKELAS
ncbi:MAG: pyrroline-5-carboxylate reductase [Moraxellaceae bacterium]|nr:MAG: pyrroline-5-carboxylate reductase [Moraxellaceae bacterium]